MSHPTARGTAAPVLALTLFAAALGLLTQPDLTAQDKTKARKNSLDGAWNAVSLRAPGKTFPTEQVRRLRLTFQGNKATFTFLRNAKKGTVTFDAARTPGQFDLKLDGEHPNPGIYRLDKDTLTLYFSDGGVRPARFEAEPAPRTVLLVLEREVPPELAQKSGGASSAVGRAQSANNLKQLALAMHSYVDVNKYLPMQAIYGKDGKPLLSWRVAILPYVEQDNLYKQFKLDEAWDSPHNKKLLAIVPPVYAPVTGKTKQPYSTYYQVFTGPGTAFEGSKKLRFPADFPDGTSNTILMVEAGEAVPWTKPQDLPYDPRKELPKLGGLFPDGFHIAMCDGSVRFLSRRFNRDNFRLAITRNDGQPIDPDALDP